MVLIVIFKYENGIIYIMALNQQVMDSNYQRRLDIQNLRRIMTYGRPASSEMEKEWVNKYLYTPEMQAQGLYKDGFHYGRQAGEGEGNLIIKVGEGSKTLFSSHTDTVHRSGVIQNVIIDPTQEKLKFTTDSNQCLGGDDGTGVWLMLELIKAGVPGLYIFHRAEEVGGQGSSYIANSTPELIEGYDRAIAFDRKDDWSIITHQAGVRTCSDEFAEDLAKQLGMNHRADSTGSFTDTANYDTIIPECTNLSVGYHNAHSARENQEIDYLLKFRDALVNVDWENLVTARDPSIPEYSSYGYYGYGDRLLKPKRSVREKMDWGDWEDQNFERNRQKLEKEKEMAGQAEPEEPKDLITLEITDDADDPLDFLSKGVMQMTDDEYSLYEMLENGVISEGELRDMLIDGANYDVDYEEDMVESTLPEGFEDFFDDYDMKYPQVEKDYADYEDDDFEWDDWFQGQ